jgi:hypothetical protein
MRNFAEHDGKLFASWQALSDAQRMICVPVGYAQSAVSVPNVPKGMKAERWSSKMFSPIKTDWHAFLVDNSLCGDVDSNLAESVCYDVFANNTVISLGSLKMALVV